MSASSHFYAASALKFLSVIIGATAYGLAVYSYDETNLPEEFFLRCVQAYFFLSTIYLCVILLCFVFSEKIAGSELNKAFDIVFHISGTIILLIVAGLAIYTAVDNERTYCDILHISYPELFCQFYREKFAAGVICAMNGTLYALIACTVFLSHMSARKLKQKENEPGTMTYHQKRQFQPKSFYFGAK